MCGIAAIIQYLQQPSSEPGPSQFPVPQPPSRLSSAPSLQRRGPDQQADLVVGAGRIHLGASVLHMRGGSLEPQPLRDAAGNVLLWNGEVFSGAIAVAPCASDTAAVLSALTQGTRTVPEVLASIEGPYALVFWHEATSTLWYGRDPLGRRSLLRLRELPQSPSSQPWASIRLSSVVSDPSATAGDGPSAPCAWEELATDGIASVQLLANGGAESAWHPWPPGGVPLRRAPCAAWHHAAWLEQERAAAAAELLARLSDAVRRRVSPESGAQVAAPRAGASSGSAARVAVMFSGGIDSMVLARLADVHVPVHEPIDLLNVAFGVEAAEAPDRLTGLAGLEELRALSPRRPWRFVEVDISLQELLDARGRLLELLLPASTVMDVNIGAALWFGAKGEGRLRTRGDGAGGASAEVAAAVCRYHQDATGGDADARQARPAVLDARLRCEDKQGQPCVELSIDWVREPVAPPAEAQAAAGALGGLPRFRTEARALLLGMGADEQMAGYGRHRTTFARHGWTGLSEALDVERERIWLRNLGRDDRIISDWGCEVRHPFLDEKVMRFLAELPLPLVCDLEQGLGCGDKLILRSAARLLGLTRSTGLQKRAIQFGTRIANRGVYGGASVRGDIDLSEVVHPRAGGGAKVVGTPARTELNKKKRGPRRADEA